MTWSSVAPSACRIMLNFELVGTAVFCHRILALYSSCSITALYQMVSTSQEQCSKIHFSLHKSRSRGACSMSSWPPQSSEVNMRHKTSSLCSRSIAQFVWNSEFSYFLVCSVSSCKDNIWQDKMEQDRSFVLLLNASLDLVSVGQWFSGFQLCSMENFRHWEQLSSSSARALDCRSPLSATREGVTLCRNSGYYTNQ